MAIAIGDNFSYQGEKFLDGRDCFKTLSDMKNYPEVSVPDGFKTYCKEDGREYRITKTNDIDPITGRWRVAEVEIDLDDYYTKDEIDTKPLSEFPADRIIVHKEGFQIGNLNKLDGWNVSIGYQNEVLGGGEDNLISGRGNVSFTWNSNINGNENIAGCFDFNGEITPVKYNSTSVVIKKSDVSEIPTVGSYFFVKWEDIGSFHISEVLEFVNNGTPCYELVFDNNTISEESLIYLNNYIQYRGIIVIYKPYAFDDYFAGCFTEGSKNACLAYGGHVEGFCNKVLNNFSHSEGCENEASGYASHTEGYFNQATGDYSHSEGTENSSTGVASHTEGYFNQATGNYSHAEGWGNIASNRSEHACGSYNVSTKSNNTAQATQFSIGIGTGESNRKNGIEVKKNGDVYVEGISGTLQTNISDRYTKSEVDQKISDITVDLSDYYNKAEVDQKIADIDINIDGADIDLSNYAKKTDLEPIQTGLQKVSDRVSGYQGVIVKNHYIDGFTTNIESFKNKSISFYLERGETANQMVLSNVSASAGFRVTINASNQLVVYYNGVYIIDNAFTSGYLTFTFDNEGTLNVYLNGVVTLIRSYLESNWKPDWLLGIGIKATEPNKSYIRNFRTFNYALTQSDVDMLYNQGRFNDVVLPDSYRNFKGDITIERGTNGGSASFTGGILTYKATSVGTNRGVYLRSPKNNVGVFCQFDIMLLQEGLEAYNVSSTNALTKVDFSIVNEWQTITIEKQGTDTGGNILFYTKEVTDAHNLDMNLYQMKNIRIYSLGVLDEFTPENITSTEWINTGTQVGNIEFTDPTFTTEAPIKERQWQLSTATKPVPVAFGQKLYNTDNGLIFEAGAKPNTRQFTVSDWKQLN